MNPIFLVNIIIQFSVGKSLEIHYFSIFFKGISLPRLLFSAKVGGSILRMAVARSLGMSCGATDPGGRQDPGTDEGGRDTMGRPSHGKVAQFLM